jgi:hypothetical protein
MNSYKMLLTHLFSEKSTIETLLSSNIIFTTLKILGKKAKSGDFIAKQILANYACCGAEKIHAKVHAFALFADSVNTHDKPLLPYVDYYLNWLLELYKPINEFQKLIAVQYEMPSIAMDGIIHTNLKEQVSMAHWSINAKLKICGREFYPQLVQIACAIHLPVELRAKAIKSLSLHSKQTFDRLLPRHPSNWNEAHFRLKELLEWEKEGYPEGEGYAEPEQSPALLNPITPLEIACANLEKILAKSRAYSYDPAYPTNLLTIGNKKEIETIIKKHQLPLTYLDFLQRFSPLEVTIYSSKFTNFLTLYGTFNLLKDSSCFGPIPSDYVIIGDDGGHNIYVLDLSKSNGIEAPVLWMSDSNDTFVKYANSFLEFLEGLSKKK